jgi:ribose 1,5-bisphosphokinase PhnN
VITIEITLSKDMLYKRLKNRGRETEEQIQKRLERSYNKIEAKQIIQFDNSKSIKESSIDFLELLQRIDNEK